MRERHTALIVWILLACTGVAICALLVINALIIAADNGAVFRFHESLLKNSVVSFCETRHYDSLSSSLRQFKLLCETTGRSREIYLKTIDDLRGALPENVSTERLPFDLVLSDRNADPYGLCRKGGAALQGEARTAERQRFVMDLSCDAVLLERELESGFRDGWLTHDDLATIEGVLEQRGMLISWLKGQIHLETMYSVDCME